MTNLQKLKKSLIECKPQEVINKYALLVAEEYGKENDLEFLKSIGYIEIEKVKKKEWKNENRNKKNIINLYKCIIVSKISWLFMSNRQF